MEEKVLIIDDHRDNLDLFTDLIKEIDDAEVHVATSGAEAMTLIDKVKFDLILLDIQLPEMNGFEIAAAIRKNAINSETSIIFITAHDPQKLEMEKGWIAGGIDYLTKPVDYNEFTRLIGLYLRFIRREKEINKKLYQTNKSLQEEIQSHKKTEALLDKAQENFKNIVGKSKAAILIIDNEGVLRFINPSGEEIFQRSSEEIIGKPFGQLSDFEKKTEITILRKDKQIGTGEITATPTYWENEPAWLVLINDITDHKNLQDHLVKAKEDAQRADRLKTAFLSNMSHEIRTPMNGIVGFVDILERDQELTEEERKKYLGIIRSSSNHLLTLINDIVDISKIEAGQLILNIKDCNISELILELYEFFSTNIKIQENRIELLFEVPIGENLIIRTDPDRLKQVLLNLIGNSIKYTDKGHIKFGCTIEKETQLTFFVEDTGPGIPKEHHERIFKRFVQIIDEKKTYMSGTGLGLAISKSLVELLGGDIWIESNGSQGASFFFTLPYIKKVSTKKPVEPSNNHIQADVSFDKTILIAEDIATNYMLLENILKKNGSKTIWAKNGDEAVTLCKSNNVSLVLMDMKMPIMDGYEATKAIRKFNKKLPIIAQTAYALQGEHEKSLEAGCNDYLTKPIDQQQLLSVVQKYLK